MAKLEKKLGRKGPRGLGGHEVEDEPALCAWGKRLKHRRVCLNMTKQLFYCESD